MAKKIKKKCKRCEKRKPLSAFATERRNSDGRHSYCRECQSASRTRHLLRTKYDLTPEELEEMKAAQAYRCAVCARKRKLVIDHNHETGLVRGLLCTQCNVALGMLGDDLVFISALEGYLRQTDPEKIGELVKVQAALLDLFSVLDAIFTEDDALSPAKRKMSLGRAYESWKRCRAVLDPEFDPTNHQRPPQFGTVRVGLSRR